MRKLAVFLSFVLFVVGTVLPAAADGDAGRSTGQVLRIGSGADVPATGNARTGSVFGSAALDYNPAGLARTRWEDRSFMYQKLVEDITLFTGGMTQPLRSNETLGISFKMLNYGSEDRTVLNTGGSGVSASDAGTFDGQDLVASVGLGHAYQSGHHFGLSLKYLRMTIDDARAGGFALDAGWQYRLGERGPFVGLTVQNLGPDVTFDRRNERLPALGRLGFSSRLFSDQLVGYLDLEKVRDRDVNWMGGVTWKAFRGVSLRTGYDGRSDLDDGITAGIGLSLDNMKFDYAYLPYGEFGNSHRFGFTWNFGGERTARSGTDERASNAPAREAVPPEIVAADDVENNDDLRINVLTETPTVGQTVAMLVEGSTRGDRYSWNVGEKTITRPADERITVRFLGAGEYRVHVRSVGTDSEKAVERTIRVHPLEHEMKRPDKPENSKRSLVKGGSGPSDSFVEHAVRKGETLWGISRSRLEKTWKLAKRKLSRVVGPDGTFEPSDRDVYHYWILVIEENRHRLRSGNPGTIYPGETILLPEVPRELLPEEDPR